MGTWMMRVGVIFTHATFTKGMSKGEWLRANLHPLRAASLVALQASRLLQAAGKVMAGASDPAKDERFWNSGSDQSPHSIIDLGICSLK